MAEKKGRADKQTGMIRQTREKGQIGQAGMTRQTRQAGQKGQTGMIRQTRELGKQEKQE